VCAAAYAKLGQGLDLDALEQAATAIGTGSRRREDVSKKRDAEDADGEGPSKVSLVGVEGWSGVSVTTACGSGATCVRAAQDADGEGSSKV
jgi:hypothetical protein